LSDPLDFGKGPLTTVDPPDAFVALFEPSGALIWAKSYPGPGWQIPHHMVIEPISEDLILTGTLRDNASISFGGDIVSANGGAFFARLTSAGSHVHSRAVERFGEPHGLVVDGNGEIATAGPFVDVVDFGGEPVATEGTQDGILAKLAPDLTRRWTLQVGSIAYDNVWDVASDEANQLFVAGYFQDHIQLEGCGTLTSAGDSDVLLVKLDR
jgi:hypothetical protein